jgi:hypothetical protein
METVFWEQNLYLFFIHLLFQTFFDAINIFEIMLEMSIEMHVGLPAKCPTLLSDFNQTLHMLRNFSKPSQHQISRKQIH